MVEFRSVGISEKLMANPAGALRKSKPSVTPSVPRLAIIFWMIYQTAAQRIATTTTCQMMPRLRSSRHHATAAGRLVVRPALMSATSHLPLD